MKRVWAWLKRWWQWVAIALALVAGFVAGVLVRRPRPAPPAPVDVPAPTLPPANTFHLTEAERKLEEQREVLRAQGAQATAAATADITTTLGGHDAIDQDTDGSGVDVVLYGRKTNGGAGGPAAPNG